MIEEKDDNLIHTNTGITQDLKPCVVWRYRAYSGIFTLAEAKTKAMGLMHAIAIAQAEDAIATMIGKDLESKGFGSKVMQEREKTHVKLLMRLRGARPTLVEGIEPIRGHRTKQLIINVYWYGEGVQLSMAEATYHSEVLIRVAEAAESDAFLRSFLLERGGSLMESQVLIEEFARYREQQRLEQLV